jgi:hypothetical protein
MRALAVIVPSPPTPIAAIAVRGSSPELAREQQRLVALLGRAAAQVARDGQGPVANTSAFARHQSFLNVRA